MRGGPTAAWLDLMVALCTWRMVGLTSYALSGIDMAFAVRLAGSDFDICGDVMMVFTSGRAQA